MINDELPRVATKTASWPRRDGDQVWMETSSLSTCSFCRVPWRLHLAQQLGLTAFGGEGRTAENPPRRLCSSKGVATFTTEQSWLRWFWQLSLLWRWLSCCWMNERCLHPLVYSMPFILKSIMCFSYFCNILSISLSLCVSLSPSLSPSFPSSPSPFSPRWGRHHL